MTYSHVARWVYHPRLAASERFRNPSTPLGLGVSPAETHLFRSMQVITVVSGDTQRGTLEAHHCYITHVKCFFCFLTMMGTGQSTITVLFFLNRLSIRDIDASIHEKYSVFMNMKEKKSAYFGFAKRDVSYIHRTQIVKWRLRWIYRLAP